MKYYLKTIYPLVTLAVFFGLSLSVAYNALSPKIDAAKVAEEQAALQAVFPAGENFNSIGEGDDAYYEVTDSASEIIGYIFKEGNIGYGGPIVTLVGINTEKTVESIFVLSADQETPGLGYKCMEGPWQEQFKGLSEFEVPAGKSDFPANGLEAITGATLSSMGIANNISDAFKTFNSVYIPTIDTNEGATNGIE